MARLLLPAFLALAAAAASARPLVIAHRGASGYLPEHTLEAAAFAYASGADFIEQDVVLSRDGVLVVIHDIHLDATTDVAARFPGRQRADGRFYVLDFTWDELRTLRVRERTDPRTGKVVYPARFPSRPDDGTGFRLCRLEEQLALVAGLNRATGRRVGVYPEFKEPAWHRREGRDLGAALLEVLARHGLKEAGDPVIVQCFDPVELRRLREELGTRLTLVQLIGDLREESDGVDYAAMVRPEGLRAIAAYAQGIGPHLGHIVAGFEPDGRPRFTTLVADAHAAGLKVHPYTFRADALPPGVADFDRLLDLFLREAGVDGGFFDQPDLAVRFLDARR
jgi:glycerophosphoryl diester phosphodiesterase